MTLPSRILHFFWVFRIFKVLLNFDYFTNYFISVSAIFSIYYLNKLFCLSPINFYSSLLLFLYEDYRLLEKT